MNRALLDTNLRSYDDNYKTIVSQMMKAGRKISMTNISTTNNSGNGMPYSQYTPSYNAHSKQYSPTLKTEKYSDGKNRYTEPWDWTKKASASKGTVNRKRKRATNIPNNK